MTLMVGFKCCGSSFSSCIAFSCLHCLCAHAVAVGCLILDDKWTYCLQKLCTPSCVCHMPTKDSPCQVWVMWPLIIINLIYGCKFWSFHSAKLKLWASLISFIFWGYLIDILLRIILLRSFLNSWGSKTFVKVVELQLISSGGVPVTM